MKLEVQFEFVSLDEPFALAHMLIDNNKDLIILKDSILITITKTEDDKPNVLGFHCNVGFKYVQRGTYRVWINE